jgi:WD40 repeat protein
LQCKTLFSNHFYNIALRKFGFKFSMGSLLSESNQGLVCHTTYDRSLSIRHHGNLPISSSRQDINSVAVSPNDKLLASGSQDRMAKLWSLGAPGAGPALLGVFRGHKRGVWAVCFSPVDQVLASSSADGTAKLWSLQDYSCLKVHGPTYSEHSSFGLISVFFVILFSVKSIALRCH